MGNSPDIERVDVYDLYADVSSESRVQHFDTYLENTSPDFAVVATPTRTHRELAEKLISRSIPTLIEKPIASSLEEAQSLKSLADQHSVKGVVGFIERCNPVVRALREEIRNAKIYSISITRVGPFPPRIKDVGVLVDLSVHDIDLVSFLLDGAEFEKYRIYSNENHHGEFEDNAIIAIKTKNNVIANLITNWVTPFKKRTIEVATDKAYYEANLISRELKAYSHYKSDDSYIVRNCPVAEGEPLALQLQAFVHYVRTGEIDSLASYEDGIKTLRFLEKYR